MCNAKEVPINQLFHNLSFFFSFLKHAVIQTQTGCDVFGRIFKRSECLSQHQQQQQQSHATPDAVNPAACCSPTSSSSSLPPCLQDASLMMTMMPLDEVSCFMDGKMREIDRIFRQEDEVEFSEGCSMCEEMHRRESGPWLASIGRLGQEVVNFDASTSIGSLSMDLDRVSIASHSGFSSIKANVCVFRGKWQYEVLLSSKGVMQIGWATKHCSFSQEKGVGDSSDSYAFDGSRVRKWNLNTDPYGESWFPGDVIGTTIDLESGTIDFYRNGRHLGLAFDSVKIGPGYCYFPAVSLAYSESLIANFGALPLKYPVPGFQPLQQVPLPAVTKADVLINWFFNLVEFCSQQPDNGNNSNNNSSIQSLTSMLLASLILERLGELLRSKFVIESSLVKKLLSVQDDQVVYQFMDMCWTLMDQEDVHFMMEHVSSSLVNGYRSSPVILRRRSTSNSRDGMDGSSVYTISPDLLPSSSSSQTHSHCQHHQKSQTSHHQDHDRNTNLTMPNISFPTQKKYLSTFLSLIRHSKTRNFLLKGILFEKSKFPHLLDIKSVNEPDWLKGEIFPDHILHPDHGPSTATAKGIKSCEIETAISEVEGMQAMILDTLIFQDEVSRLMFIAKFDQFLKDNCPHPLISQVRIPGAASNASPLPVTSSVFHRLVNLIRIQYQDMVSMIPIEFFLDPCHGVPMDQLRIGGVMSHLCKIYDKEIRDHRSNDQQMNPLLKHVYILIHGLIKLYSSSAHKLLTKHCGIRDRLIEVSNSLQVLSTMSPSESSKHAATILKQELNQKMRQQACLNSSILTAGKLSDLMFLIRLLLKTLNHGSESGLLSFIPDFYLESCLNLCHAVRSFFGFSILSTYPQFGTPLTPTDVQDYEMMMKQFARFLSTHFNDERIASSDLRDSLSQGLAGLMSQTETLRIVEEIPLCDREKMIKSLLQPYENRSWIHSNCILLRVWKGDGFAYRSTGPSDTTCNLLTPSLISNKEITASLNNAIPSPTPSPVFQHHVRDYLTKNPRDAQSFLSALLSQLNCSFSEFIGMLQEMQNAANKPEKVFIDSRQLKICFSGFDVSISLLRVLEMIAVLNPELLTRDSPASASTPVPSSSSSCQLLPSQLSSLLNQILNRVTSKTGSFDFVTSLEIPGLEAISHSAILSAVSGILIALILRGPKDSRDAAVKSFISDANFLPSNLNFVPQPAAVKTKQAAPMTTTTRKVSSASTSSMCDDVSSESTPKATTTAAAASDQKAIMVMDLLNEMTPEEEDDLRDMVTVVHAAFLAAASMDESQNISDEDVCTICYANKKSTTFVPCGHQSCR